VEEMKRRQAEESLRQAKEQVQEAKQREQKSKEGEQKAKEARQHAMQTMLLMNRNAGKREHRLIDAMSNAMKADKAMRLAEQKRQEAEQNAQEALQTMRQVEFRAKRAEDKANFYEEATRTAEETTCNAEERARLSEQRAKMFERRAHGAEQRTSKARQRASEAGEQALDITGLESSVVVSELESTVAILSGSVVSMHREIEELQIIVTSRTEQLRESSETAGLLCIQFETSKKEKLGLLKAVAKLRSAEIDHNTCKYQLKQAHAKAKEKVKVHQKELDAVLKSSNEKQKALSYKVKVAEIDRDSIRIREGSALTLLKNARELILEEKGKLDLLTKALTLAETSCDIHQRELQRVHGEEKEKLEVHTKELDAVRMQRDHLLSTVECAVCIETKVEPTVLLPCCHSFCGLCVIKCLRGRDGHFKEGAKCPICRTATTDAKRLF
jgi:hypothetical protein